MTNCSERKELARVVLEGEIVEPTGYVEYDSNNSGGSFWLSDQNWHDLEQAGWEVEWVANRDSRWFKTDTNGRWLGTLATGAKRYGLSLRDAIEEWESVTGQDSNALGCSCCGPPHSFNAYDRDGKYVDYYSPSYPAFGERY